MMDYVLNAITYLTTHWNLILGYTVDGFSIAVILSWLEHKWHLDQTVVRIFKVVKLDGAQIVLVLMTLLAMGDDFINWIADGRHTGLVPQEFAAILVPALYLHRFLTSPAGVKLKKWSAPYVQALNNVKDAELAKEHLAGGAAPAGAAMLQTAAVAQGAFSPQNPQNQVVPGGVPHP